MRDMPARGNGPSCRNTLLMDDLAIAQLGLVTRSLREQLEIVAELDYFLNYCSVVVSTVSGRLRNLREERLQPEIVRNWHLGTTALLALSDVTSCESDLEELLTLCRCLHLGAVGQAEVLCNRLGLDAAQGTPGGLAVPREPATRAARRAEWHSRRRGGQSRRRLRTAE